jgi:hypothetical protein
MNKARISENGFEANAHEAFDFLVSDFGFRCAASTPTLVRYESPVVWFEAGYAVSYDHEVIARVGRISAPGKLSEEPAERLDFGLLLAVADPDGCAAIRRDVPYCIAHSVEQVRRVLSWHATGLRRYGTALLAADGPAYSRAREVRWWHAPDAPI